jgi:hypothetical protein
MFGDGIRQTTQQERLPAQDLETLKAWRNLNPVIKAFSLKAPKAEKGWRRYLDRTLLGDVLIGKKSLPMSDQRVELAKLRRVFYT